MRWLADECVAAPLVAFLRTGGHNVLYVAEAAAGFSDSDVLALALLDDVFGRAPGDDFAGPSGRDWHQFEDMAVF